MAFILGVLLGIYIGGGFVTSITVASIDGETVTWKDSLFVALLWWQVLLDARRNERG